MARVMHNARLAAACVHLLVVAACDDTPRRQTESPVATEYSDEQLLAMPLADLEALHAGTAKLAAQHEASERGVRAALELSRITRLVMLRGGPERYLGEARRWLSRAARRSDLPGACEAALELARIEASVAHDARAAYLAAHGLTTRFEGLAGVGACLREARRMLAILAEYRAEAGAVARESLSAVLEGAPGEGASKSNLQREVELAGFVARRAQSQQQGSTLQRISVYGAAPRAEAGIAPRSVRAVLHFDGVAVYRRGEIPATEGVPRRLFLDLDEARMDERVGDVLAVGAGGLSRIRTLSLGPGSVRVSFDVAPATAYRLFVLTDPYRIVMDFQDEQQGVRQAPARWTVVLDPGHGGSQPGAKSGSGLRESDVALALARRVKAALARKLPDARVLLTREGDQSVSLEERTAIANGYDADAFVSIHLNASHSPEDLGGVTTFVLDTANDEAALRLAARENDTDTADVTELQVLLASLYRADQVQKSQSLAELVQRDTLRLGRRHLPELPDRGVKRALFYVLVGARMPAVLVEASFMTRPEEAQALETEEYRDLLAEGIAGGIDGYLRKAALADSTAGR